MTKTKPVLDYCQLTESQEHRNALEENLLEPTLYHYRGVSNDL